MISRKLHTVGELRDQLAGIKGYIPIRLSCDEHNGENNGLYVEVTSEDYEPPVPDFTCILKQYDR